MQLNDEQKIAVEHMEGPCLVVSPPGSGKTRVITARTVRLIEKRIAGSRILNITFTNKAANEMKERICKELGVKKPPSFIGTFHALSVQILKSFGHHLGYTSSFSIVDSNDQKDLVEQIARKKGYVDLSNGDIWNIINALNNSREQLEGAEGLEDALDKDLFPIANDYLKHLSDSNMIDFSGLLSETIKLFEIYPQVLERVQNRFDMVQVDESQDTNHAQFFIAESITKKSNNLLLVADTDQSIYGWRGARPDNIKDYTDRHSDCKIIYMLINYRSTPEIVNTAINLISHNKGRLGTKYDTINDSGKDVQCVCKDDQFQEAEWVADEIKSLIARGTPPNEIAVLYRANRMSEPVERALVSKGVAYEVIGSRSFYDRKEIRDCLAMLRLKANPLDGIAFNRVANVVSGIGAVTVGKIENMVSDDKINILDACKKVIDGSNSVKIKQGLSKIVEAYESLDSSQPVAEVVRTLANQFEYKKHLEKHDEQSFLDRVENVKQLIESATNFYDSDTTVESYLQSVALITSSDKKNDEDKVQLITIHSSKGLEYICVVVIGCEENILPHSLSLVDDPDGSEERRTLYVGMTRAKELLYLSYCARRKHFAKAGRVFFKPTRPSRFLYEAGVLKN